MRRYPGMRLPPGQDPVVRNELLKADRQLKQLSSALAKSLTKSNLPTAIISVGGGGSGGGGVLPPRTRSVFIPPRAMEVGVTLEDEFGLGVYAMAYCKLIAGYDTPVLATVMPPYDYDGTLGWFGYFASPETTGTAKINIDFQPLQDGSDITGTPADNTDTVSFTVPASAYDMKIVQLTTKTAGVVAGGLVRVVVTRKGTEDSLAGDLGLLGLELRYTADM